MNIGFQSRQKPQARPCDGSATPVEPGRKPSAQSVTASRGRLPLFLQHKPAVSQPQDPAEQEADRVADQVMGLPASTVEAQPSTRPSRPLVQRRADESSAGFAEAPSVVHEALRSPGQPLDRPTRAYFEPRFGQDFSDVRVHADQTADRSARQVSALAYTVGQDLVFRAGCFTPGTQEGRRLIAHELTHVVQQTSRAGSSQRPHLLSRYRQKGKDTIAFDSANETLTDPTTQPWIDTMTIVFDKATVDTGHKADAKAAGQLEPRMPTGTLTAKYSTKSSKVLPDVVVPIAGGSTMLGIGLTDRVKASKVTRLEGSGYMDSENIRLGNLKDPVAKTGKGARYSASGAGSMNYAIFFKGIQAIHEGLLNTGSHACVHVGSQSKIRALNYHSRIGVTTVTVRYDSAVLDDLCCHRKTTGNANWNGNPCEKTTCP